jgi:cyclopropane fatty-acyl-phospholipid synthase-like methyltransferase
VNSKSDPTNPRQVVERGYDQVAHEYARLEEESEWPRMRWLRKLLNRLEPGSSVLDLGCGSGEPADVEISKEHQVTGVDISRTQINLARQNVPTGHFLHGDAGLAEFPPSSFDAVVSFYTLEHIPREEHRAVLRRINNWLRVGGLLLISIEAGDYDDVVDVWLGVPMFISCYDPETMKQMVTEAGFELLETAIEIQLEGGKDIPFLWVFAQKR